MDYQRSKKSDKKKKTKELYGKFSNKHIRQVEEVKKSNSQQKNQK